MVIIFCVFLESNLCDILCSKMYQICIKYYAFRMGKYVSDTACNSN